MSKLAAGLLLVVGLAIGLWLGFNPKAHQETVQNWDRVTAAVAHIGFNTGGKTHTLLLPVASAKPAKPAAQPQFSASAAWKQVSVALETFWNSVQRTWRSVTASISHTR